MSASKMIKELKALGATKYGIAKECGVTWQAVHAWEREFYEPKDIAPLQALLEKFRATPGKSPRQKLLDELAELDRQESLTSE